MIEREKINHNPFVFVIHLIRKKITINMSKKKNIFWFIPLYHVQFFFVGFPKKESKKQNKMTSRRRINSVLFLRLKIFHCENHIVVQIIDEKLFASFNRQWCKMFNNEKQQRRRRQTISISVRSNKKKPIIIVILDTFQATTTKIKLKEKNSFCCKLLTERY